SCHPSNDISPRRRGDRMRRREFIKLIGGTAAAWSTFASAQQNIPRIGILWHGANEEEEAIYLGAVRQGLGDFGYVEGKNIILENRFPARRRRCLARRIIFCLP